MKKKKHNRGKTNIMACEKYFQGLLHFAQLGTTKMLKLNIFIV